MHSYLRSIGFSRIKTKKELDWILNDVLENYDEKIVVENGDNHLYAEISMAYGFDSGLTIWGEYDEHNKFHMEYYYPYFRGTDVSTTEEVVIEKHAGKESYAGACDDVRMGVTLIFYLLNAGEYVTERDKKAIKNKMMSVTLSGLALDGRVLLPVEKNSQQIKNDQNAMVNRNHLIAAARNGDEDAMESLTMEDIDMYTMLSRRILHEDVFTIVDSYFMPYGMECDQYSIMGEIKEVIEITNIRTAERMYQLNISCNDIEFDICINQKDMMGIPEQGRRFKGTIWMQGYLNY
jgi:hypothetical protein